MRPWQRSGSPGHKRRRAAGRRPPEIAPAVTHNHSRPPANPDAGFVSLQIQQQVPGLLPSPAVVREFEAVYPGAAKWIFDQAEKNADHVKAMERLAAEVQTHDVRMRRVLPFAGVIAFLVAGVAITFISPWAGAATVAVTMGSVLYTYLTGRAPPPSQQHAPSPRRPEQQ